MYTEYNTLFHQPNFSTARNLPSGKNGKKKHRHCPDDNTGNGTG
jgi:hypothetical protein